MMDGKKAIFIILYVLSLLLVFFIIFEVGLRLTDSPTRLFYGNTTVEPGGTFLQPDPVLGFSLKPGDYTISYKTNYSYALSISSDGRRVTGRQGSGNDASLGKKLWVFGCSFTFGQSVNDDETYPWLLNSRLKGWDVINFGVPAYGTLQSLIQLENELGSGAMPDAVILTYASFHDARNVYSRAYSDHIMISDDEVPIPSYDLNDSWVRVAFKELFYSRLHFLKDLRVVRFIGGNQIFEKHVLGSQDATKQIIRDFNERCIKENITLVFIGVDDNHRTKDMLAYTSSLGIMSADISHRFGDYTYINFPHDPHPNQAAHADFADKIMTILEANDIA
ncbi:hypothetical protein ACFLRF_06670 [Candidatus Altiarchaeota archaeon]